MVKKIAITGAFSYTGRYVAQEVIKRNWSIVNLTNHPSRPWKNLDETNITTYPYNFQNKKELVEKLQGVDYFLSTYWVRFDDYGGYTRQQVIDNSKFLIDCAKEAGVKKLVYISHTQTSLDSPFPYIQGKAQIEQHLKESGMAYGIVKPCAIFGDTPDESILMNNISFLVKWFPLFPLPGDGNYRFQPVHVRDMADLILRCFNSEENHEFDAVGPENFKYKELIQQSAKILNTTCIPITGIPKSVCYYSTKPIDWLFQDRLIDQNDLDTMISGLTQSLDQPTGKIKYTDWLEENKNDIGKKWISSIARYYDKKTN